MTDVAAALGSDPIATIDHLFGALGRILCRFRSAGRAAPLLAVHDVRLGLRTGWEDP
jgi:hypothetical protein